MRCFAFLLLFFLTSTLLNASDASEDRIMRAKADFEQLHVAGAIDPTPYGCGEGSKPLVIDWAEELAKVEVETHDFFPDSESFLVFCMSEEGKVARASNRLLSLGFFHRIWWEAVFNVFPDKTLEELEALVGAIKESVKGRVGAIGSCGALPPGRLQRWLIGTHLLGVAKEYGLVIEGISTLECGIRALKAEARQSSYLEGHPGARERIEKAIDEIAASYK